MGVFLKSGFSFSIFKRALVIDNYIAEKLSVSSVSFARFDSEDQTQFHLTRFKFDWNKNPYRHNERNCFLYAVGERD